MTASADSHKIAALSCMYMSDGEFFRCDEEGQPDWDSPDCFSLLLLTRGQAVCHSGDEEYRLARGDCLLLPAAARITLSAEGTEPPEGYRIAFRFLPSAAGQQLAPELLLPLGRTIRIKPLTRLRDAAEALCGAAGLGREDARSRNELQAFQAHITFQQLICRVLEQSGPDSAASDSIDAVKASIAYLQEHYADEHSVQQLAKSTNLGTRQYTRLFKRLTGRTPIDYLHEYRINRSRERLLLSDSPLRRISHSIGIEDVHYFNRLFKTTVGCSPKAYVRSRNLDSRIVTMHYVGELLALDMPPLGELDLTLNQIQGNIRQIASIGKESPDPARIAQLRPDLIVASDFMRREDLAALKGAAPVIVVPWDIRPFERLQRIAGVLGKEAEAAVWLERYEAKKRQAMEWCRARTVQAETAAILRLDKDKVWVHASRFFPTFYEVMGFQPTELMQRMVESPDQERRVAVSFDRLAEADADRLYIIDGQYPEYDGWIAELLQTPAWRQLEAVKRNRAYLLKLRGISYDASSLEWQLGEVERLWGDPQPPDGQADNGWLKAWPDVYVDGEDASQRER